MARKAILPFPEDEHNNGEGRSGEAKEPAQPSDQDTGFDPSTFSTPQEPIGPDPFDPDSLRLDHDLSASMKVKKVLLSVPVRKPHNSWFVRIHPSQDYRLNAGIIELKEEREIYLVVPSLIPDLAGEATFSPRVLFTAINRQGVPFLWPVRLPGTDGKLDEWSRTAMESAVMAQSHWVRTTANMSLGCYDVFKAMGQLPEPEWPEHPFKELLRIAFRDKRIDTPDHPILKKLRGEV